MHFLQLNDRFEDHVRLTPLRIRIPEAYGKLDRPPYKLFLLNVARSSSGPRPVEGRIEHRSAVS